MAPRSFWKGYLKLSLVTCPVTLLPATTEADKLRFHILNARTGHRVVSQYVDAGTGRTLGDDDAVKGYPRGEDDHVMLEDDEIEAVALDSTRTIEIDQFVPADSIGWIWLDKPHYLSPADKIGAEAFAVIREAMAQSGVVGISRLVMYRRERAVMLQPRGKGIVLWTLHYGDEVRDPDAYFPGPGDKPDARAMTLLRKLIDARTKAWDPKMVDDPVQDRLLDLIAARKPGKKRAAKPKPGKAQPAKAQDDNVVNIMDALRKSLKSGKS